MSTKSDIGVSQARVEKEAAGYINGGNDSERRDCIRNIWSHIQSSTDHFRAPNLQPRSCPSLVRSSQIETERSELHIDERSKRHIIYMDELDLSLRSVGVQVRLERKRKPKKGDLRKAFYEVTIKIGNKAEERLEDAVRVNLKTWKKKGFAAALRAGIEAEVKYVRKKKGKDEAKKRRGELKALMTEFQKRVSEGFEKSLDEIEPYPLVHLNRNTFETEYTPNGSKKTVLELKTDDCDWETTIQDTGHFGQIEIEHIKGSKKAYKNELRALISNPDFGIRETSDSKEDPAMRVLETVLLPQNNSQEERDRVQRNREILAENLDIMCFESLDPEALGIVRQPQLQAA